MLDQRGQLLRTLKAIVGSCGCAFFLGACAIANTPQQDLAYARRAKCSAPYVSLERIDLDGRIRFKISNEGSRQQVLQCAASLGEAQGRRFPSPWASTLPVAHERPRGRLLAPAFGFAECSMPSFTPEEEQAHD